MLRRVYRLKSEKSWSDYFHKRDHYLRLGWKQITVEQRLSVVVQPWVCPNCGEWVSYDWLDRHHDSHSNFQGVKQI